MVLNFKSNVPNEYRSFQLLFDIMDFKSLNALQEKNIGNYLSGSLERF